MDPESDMFPGPRPHAVEFPELYLEPTAYVLQTEHLTLIARMSYLSQAL
jgi:hypothetical protein